MIGKSSLLNMAALSLALSAGTHAAMPLSEMSLVRQSRGQWLLLDNMNLEWKDQPNRVLKVKTQGN